MTKPPSSERRGTVALPDAPDQSPSEVERTRTTHAIEARLLAGELTAAEADAEFLEVALARFDFLPIDAIAELRAVGRELIESVELVETRLGSSIQEAPRPSPWRDDPEGVER